MADDRDARIAQLEAEVAALGVEFDAARQRETALAADLTDSREQQVATAAVLRVIASPTSDLSVVLEAVLQSAMRLSSTYTDYEIALVESFADQAVIAIENARLFQELQDVNQPLMDKNGNTLVVTCPDDVGTLHADQTKVRQAPFNLLSYAAKFTEQGTITLSVRREEVPPLAGAMNCARQRWDRHLRRERHGHRDDGGAARAAVRGVLPGPRPAPGASTAGPGWAWRSAGTSAG